MSRSAKRAAIAAVVSVLTAASAAAGDVEGLGGPLFGLAAAPNGDLLVADASIGIIRLRHGEIAKTLVLPGVTDVSPIGNGALWGLTGAGETPQADTGQGLHLLSPGGSKKVIDLFEFEKAYNPDGNIPFDSNPFDVQAVGAHSALVADAGGNDLLWINSKGDVKVLAIFPNEVVSTANIKELAHCPSPAPFCSLPPAMPAQPVPTSIAVGWDGYIYVGELKGFPAPSGESNIWRISPRAHWAQCGSSPDCVKVFDGGFTSIIDLAFGPDGKLYVAELDEKSWAAVEIFGAPTGGTINACNVKTKICREVEGEIPILTAIAFRGDGSLWATRNALVPNGGEVVKVGYAHRPKPWKPFKGPMYHGSWDHH